MFIHLYLATFLMSIVVYEHLGVYNAIRLCVSEVGDGMGDLGGASA